MLKVLTIGVIVVLLALRLLRGRFGARLLGVSVRVLNVAYLIILVLTGVLAGLLEQWVLLGVVVLLLVISGLEELRRRFRPAPDVAPSRRRS